MTRPSGNNEIIWDRFLKGDETAFIEIYDRYWYKLFLSSYRRTRSKAAAEELVQELFLKLWNKRDSLQICRMENYLFSAIRNATIDYLNKEMVADKYLEHQKIYSSLEGNTTEEMVGLRDLEEALDRGLQNLPDKTEKIFRLYRMEHWPLDKIARHLRLSPKTVHYHLTKSMKYIRAYLQEYILAVLLVNM